MHHHAYVPVVKESPIVILNNNHPLTAKSELHMEDILEEGLVLPQFNYSSFMNPLVKAYARYNAYPICAYKGPDIRTLLDMVRANVGIKLTPSYILNAFTMDGLTVRSLITDDFYIEYGFLIKDLDRLKPKETYFINSMMENYNTQWQVIKE